MGRPGRRAGDLPQRPLSRERRLPLGDVAIAAEIWGPLGDPARRDQHPADLDGIARLGVLARGYGLEPEQAEELVDVIEQERRHAVANTRAQIAAGNEWSLRHWTD